MPWFITAVPPLEMARFDEEPCRTIGFFNDFFRALDAIKLNEGDLHKGLYKYLILEKITEGIHPEVIEACWYKWYNDALMWRPCVTPDELKGAVNFAVG